MEILVDANGSDNGIIEAIRGVVNSLHKTKSKLTIVGDEKVVKECIKSEYLSKADNILKSINIINAKDVITNYDDPAFAIKNKKESSIVKAYDYMKTNDNTVFISAGSTGAIMAGGLLKLKRLEGIHRPALATVLPTAKGDGVILLDSGANVTAAGVSLIQFAKMGVVYAREVLNKKDVKLAMLNIGTEDKKGSPDLKETYQTLEEEMPEFIGNIEAREILSGDADVVVANGLMGNVALKSIEGTARIMRDALVTEFKKNTINKLKAVGVKGIIKKALIKYDYTKYGGAVLLGIKKPVIKIHGNAKSQNYEAAILQADLILKQNLSKRLSEKITQK